MHWILALTVAAGLSGQADDNRVSALRGVIQDPKAENRNEAIYAVGDLGVTAAPLVPLLTTLLEEAGTLDYCTLIGASMGAYDAGPRTGESSRNESRKERDARVIQEESASAMRALRKLGGAAVKPLLAAMRGIALGDGGYHRTELALISCCKTAAEFPWEEVRTALGSSSPLVRGAAALAASESHDAARAVPLLLPNLTHSSAHVRARTVEALLEVKARGPEVFDPLVECLLDPELLVQVHAARALRTLFPGTEGVDEVLQLGLDSDQSVPCALALFTLASGGTASRDQLKSIRKTFGHSSALVRLHAINAMRRLDPENRAFGILLRRLEDDRDPRVQAAAKAAERWRKP